MVMMATDQKMVTFVLFLGLLVGVHASVGDSDPLYKTCVEECQKTGCIGDSCFQQCISSSDGSALNNPWYMQEPVYVSWKESECISNCRYHCMVKREKEREKLGLGPVKYHGKWPFKRVFGLQEPVSVALSVLNLAMQFHGWVSFIILLNYKLPVRPKDGRPYYEFAGLWKIYGLLSMNSCLCSVLFHSRDVELTERLDYSSAVALVGYSLIVAILRTFNVKNGATRVMVAAPLLAFSTTHIFYLNFYQLDYDWNMKVCGIMGLSQLLLWAVWAGFSRHPSRMKLLAVVFGGGLGMLLQVYEFPPHEGFVDAQALLFATTVPLSYLWWSFIKDDAEFMTSHLLARQKEKVDQKKVK